MTVDPLPDNPTLTRKFVEVLSRLESAGIPLEWDVQSSIWKSAALLDVYIYSVGVCHISVVVSFVMWTRGWMTLDFNRCCAHEQTVRVARIEAVTVSGLVDGVYGRARSAPLYSACDCQRFSLNHGAP